MVKIPITIFPGNEDLALPAYQTPHAAAMDLCAAVTSTVSLAPGDILLVGCGFAMAVPEGFEAQVRPLVNLGRAAFSIERGMRIAQLLVAPVARVMWEKTETLSETARGAGGFGHTGQT